MTTVTSSSNPASRIRNIDFLSRNSRKMKRQTPEAWADLFEHISEHLKPKMRFFGLTDLREVMVKTCRYPEVFVDELIPHAEHRRARVVLVVNHHNRAFFLNQDAEWLVVDMTMTGFFGLGTKVMTRTMWVDAFTHGSLTIPGNTLVQGVATMLSKAEKAAHSRHQATLREKFWAEQLFQEVLYLPN